MGRVYYESIKTVITIATEAEETFKKMVTGSYGNLLINTPPGLVENWLSNPIAQFLTDNPGQTSSTA